MEAFKVVTRRLDGALTSYAFQHFDSGCVIYSIGRRTLRLRGCGPLTAFFAKEWLAVFLDEQYPDLRLPDCTRILRVEADPSEDETIWRLRTRGLGGPQQVYLDERPRHTLPDGTALYDSIMPIEDITDRFMHEYGL